MLFGVFVVGVLSLIGPTFEEFLPKRCFKLHIRLWVLNVGCRYPSDRGCAQIKSRHRGKRIREFLLEAKVGSTLRHQLRRAAGLDNFDFSSYFQEVLHVAEVATYDRPLVHKIVLDLDVAGVQVEKV